jgi:hypothetical protein
MRARLGALLALALTACPPPPDPDDRPETAIPLVFGRTHVDALDCKRNDCTDWFRVLVPEKGELDIELRPSNTAREATSVSVTLIERSGTQVAQGRVQQTPAGQPELRLVSPVDPGLYLFALAAPKTRKRIDYRLSVLFRPAPPPPRPKTKAPVFKKVPSAVLEVEGKRTVLLEAGVRSGIRPGQSGKLIDDGRVIGEIVVIEVYNDGSRARIEGALTGAITARTRAEIQVAE